MTPAERAAEAAKAITVRYTIGNYAPGIALIIQSALETHTADLTARVKELEETLETAKEQLAAIAEANGQMAARATRAEEENGLLSRSLERALNWKDAAERERDRLRGALSVGTAEEDAIQWRERATRAEEELAKLKGKTDHPEHSCEKCGGRNIVWFADSELWNAAVGSPDGVLCPICFAALAEEKGIVASDWKLIPESALKRDGLGERVLKLLKSRRLRMLRHDENGWSAEWPIKNGWQSSPINPAALESLLDRLENSNER